jgi:uncharacterized lipoprotein
MQVITKILLLSLGLVSCGTSEDSRYRDTQMLERPPTLAGSKQAGEPQITDNSSIPKKREKTGLGSDVVMIESTPLQLIIKKPFDYAWRVLEMALNQSQIKIIDHRQDKGLYYVYYKQESLFDSVASLFNKNPEDKHHEANYVLTVKEDKKETKISANPVNPDELDSDGNVANSDEIALLWVLYKTLHDNLKEE